MKGEVKKGNAAIIDVFGSRYGSVLIWKSERSHFIKSPVEA